MQNCVMPDLRLNSPLQYVKGVGPRKAELLAKYGLKSVHDMLLYFPREYLDRTSVVPISELKTDQPATIIGVVKAHGILYGKRRRYEVILEDQGSAISLLFFSGIKYWERLFKKGQVFAASGTVTYFQGYQIIHPDLERLEDDTDKMVHAGRIIPVYPQTAELTKMGLSSKSIRRITSFIFEHLKEKIDDPVPPENCSKFSLLSLDHAIRQIHYPDDRTIIEKCRRRLAFDELLELQYVIIQSKLTKSKLTRSCTFGEPAERLSQFKEDLSFELTAAQKRVIREIFDDLHREQPMSRLLHGDVGSGKTIVAIIAALFASENNLQTAFMAPTEILAAQHYRNWSEPLEKLGVRCGLLTSSIGAKKKREVAQLCADGEIDILFGTHALIYDYVAFEKLGLVIIDEQHRFGVEQRGRLFAKGNNPDLLVMTATPIPRTLALTVYGDLDISTIDELPPGRKPIRTVWRSEDARPKVYEFIKDEVKSGGQVYVLYPLIEKSERVELENVEDAFEQLSKNELKEVRLAMVHGRTKTAERDEILKRFRDGEIDVLLATTVIEVGIDNPNASIMMIEHAERFGLAQLHQLRGRVGRGERKSTVIAIAHYPLSDIAKKRLQYFCDSDDGFSIAEADLELRGPGEIYGLKQSGLPELRAANFWKDRDLLEESRKIVSRLSESQNRLDSPDQKLYNWLIENAKRRNLSLGGG